MLQILAFNMNLIKINTVKKSSGFERKSILFVKERK